MSAATWAEIRNNFRKSMPRSAITKDYLQSILGISDKAAANLMPQLKNVGLLNPDGTPTQLAMDFRDDDHYASACAAIVENVYPVGLTDAFPDVDDNVNAIASWFMRNTGAGEQAAKYQARFYITLRQADVNALVEKKARGGSQSKPAKATTAAAKATPTKNARGSGKPAATTEKPIADTPSKPDHSPRPQTHTADPLKSRRPEIHIDIQIHIDASASREQIDAVFESMSKHLYE